ncbi:hypothetical protein FBZ87_1073 [Nitrospirillum amazonense]|uniref:Uncharacterized protein n=1 Tax=Nitrospirillum amazonense TaxID=28077 RepID=A0A560JJ89_9PROT|nr:hypothetical protein FBZ87_1073 [Nitrospirillum amazonense]
MNTAPTTIIVVGAISHRALLSAYGAVAGGGYAFAPPSTVKPVPFTERASSLAMKA